MTLAAVESGRYDRVILPWLALARGSGSTQFVSRRRAEMEREPDERVRAAVGGAALIFAGLKRRRAT